MKRPYLDQWQRLHMRIDKDKENLYTLAISWAKLKREIHRELLKIGVLN